MIRQRSWLGSTLRPGIFLAAVSGALVGFNTDVSSPPRFDGAGYAVLGESLATGQGYREIDRPGVPRHAHFPPGYPAALALLWRISGRSVAAAHLFSAACTVAAVLLAWRWFRTLYPPRPAFLLALALALNWTWGRVGGAIQSEPLYILEEVLAVLAMIRASRRGGIGAGIILGIALAASILTRHVGVCLAAAAMLELGLRGHWRALAAALVTTAVLVVPWVVWLLAVRHNTQAALLVNTSDSLVTRIAFLGLFYLQRLPDQITGPFVEVATVFRHSSRFALLANVWAVAAAAVVIGGWVRALRAPRRRLAALVPGTALALLLVWPFTEAGRFLIPLLPFVLVGATEGIAVLLCRWTKRHPRDWAVATLLAASIPYTAYGVASGRAAASRRTHDDFDIACQWIARNGTRPGPVLTRHPGEVYWQTGRLTVPPDPKAIDQQIGEFRVAYLLIDDARYANAEPNPLAHYVEQSPNRVRLVWEKNHEEAAVRIFEVLGGE